MFTAYQIFVEGTSDLIVLQRLLQEMHPDLTVKKWKSEKDEKDRLRYKVIHLSSGDCLVCYPVGGYHNIESLVLPLDIFKSQTGKDLSVAMNLLIFDADYPLGKRSQPPTKQQVKDEGGFQKRKLYLETCIDSLKKSHSFQAPYEIFMLPDDGSNGYLETLLLKALKPAPKGATECFVAFQEDLEKHKAPYPLTDKMNAGIYAWTFDKKATKSLRFDDALERDNVFDFSSPAFEPLRNFLRKHLPFLQAP